MFDTFTMVGLELIIAVRLDCDVIYAVKFSHILLDCEI